MANTSDTIKTINPELIRYSLIKYKGNIVEVTNTDNDFIYFRDDSSNERKISDDEWEPIRLTEEWLERLDIIENQKIKNVRHQLDWIVKRLGDSYYLTPKENPTIAINTVHKLQYWYYLLAGNYLVPQR